MDKMERLARMCYEASITPDPEFDEFVRTLEELKDGQLEYIIDGFLKYVNKERGQM